MNLFNEKEDFKAMGFKFFTEKHAVAFFTFLSIAGFYISFSGLFEVFPENNITYLKRSLVITGLSALVGQIPFFFYSRPKKASLAFLNAAYQVCLLFFVILWRSGFYSSDRAIPACFVTLGVFMVSFYRINNSVKLSNL